MNKNNISGNFQVSTMKIESIFRRGRRLQYSIKRQENNNY